jgi:hypothetical protein
MLSFTTLSNFSTLCSLSRSSVALHTLCCYRLSSVLPPLAISPATTCCPWSRPWGHICLDPSLDTITLLPSTSTPPPSERATIIDLDPTSLRERRHRPLPQALDTTFGEGATPPLPHYRCRVNVCRNVNEIWLFGGLWLKYDCLMRFERNLLPYVTVCRNVNEIWLCLQDLSEFDWIKLISLLNLVNFMEYVTVCRKLNEIYNCLQEFEPN